jgi:hypothetical protein
MNPTLQQDGLVTQFRGDVLWVCKLKFCGTAGDMGKIICLLHYRQCQEKDIFP